MTSVILLVVALFLIVCSKRDLEIGPGSLFVLRNNNPATAGK